MTSVSSSSDHDAAASDFTSPLFPADPLKWSLQDLLLKTSESDRGLEKVPIEILRKCVKPVVEGLKCIDAEALLQLQRVSEGARVGNGIMVRPIHSEIQPACSEETVRYIHLSDMPGQYSMGIFVFPPGSKIPLHDHPGMCVLSRVLYGSLDRLSLDLIREEEQPGSRSEDKRKKLSVPWDRTPWQSSNNQRSLVEGLPAGTRHALKRRVDQLQAPECTVLYPFEGNLHEFTAGPEGAAVLDVLFPPYDEHDRDCTFYHVIERMDDSEDGTRRQPCWIVPTGQPEDFHCISGRYRTLGASEWDY